jgi:hypothetical protein
MPGTLAYAAPATVLPQSLWTAFELTKAWPTILNAYPDGSYQPRVDGDYPRHAWKLARRPTYAQWLDLKAFWLARRGGFESFWFYPDFEDWDETGASEYGRFTVRFDGPFPTTISLCRWSPQLALIELAAADMLLA